MRHYIYCLYFCSRWLSIALLKSPRTGKRVNESGCSSSIPVIWSEELYRDFSTRAWGGTGTVGRKWRDCEDCDSHRRKEPVMSHQQAKKEPTTAVLSERGIYHSCKKSGFSTTVEHFEFQRRVQKAAQCQTLCAHCSVAIFSSIFSYAFFPTINESNILSHHSYPDP